MGSCESTEAREQAVVSKKIDKMLNAPAARMTQKLLLLGPGESGKSTCLKQMQILHNNGFTEAEIEEKKTVVYMNTVQSMIALVDAMNNFGYALQDEAMEKHARVLQAHVAAGLESQPFTPEVRMALKELWSDKGIQKCFGVRSQFHVNESAAYFFAELDRISEKNYRPTAQDILHTRVPTTGVVQVRFTLKNIDFKVFDVGGQRSERRKWIHCFDDVNGIIFVAAVSEYDQVLREDSKTNRLIEALELYDGICNSPFFDRSSMILFLNKKDIFADKITYVSLKVTFPNFKGQQTYEDGIAFLRKEFAKLNRHQRKVYMHETCATDTNQVQVVINSVIDTIVQENLKDTGMI